MHGNVNLTVCTGFNNCEHIWDGDKEAFKSFFLVGGYRLNIVDL